MDKYAGAAANEDIPIECTNVSKHQDQPVNIHQPVQIPTDSQDFGPDTIQSVPNY